MTTKAWLQAPLETTACLYRASPERPDGFHLLSYCNMLLQQAGRGLDDARAASRVLDDLAHAWVPSAGIKRCAACLKGLARERLKERAG